jgi:CheY-like chemotaxis protein
MYQVTEAGNEKEAIEIIEQGLPDLLFLDLAMPGIDWYRECRKLKDSPGGECGSKTGFAGGQDKPTHRDLR